AWKTCWGGATAHCSSTPGPPWPGLRRWRRSLPKNSGTMQPGKRGNWKTLVPWPGATSSTETRLLPAHAAMVEDLGDNAGYRIRENTMDEIDDLSDLPMPRFIWGFAVVAGKGGDVMHDEFEYLTHTRSPRFTCRVVELEDMPADSEESG